MLWTEYEKWICVCYSQDPWALYGSGLEKVWKRSQRHVGLTPRRLYAQLHSFLSHALALGNSPADLAAVDGHRTEALAMFYTSERKRGFR